jgi:hypothetical protein
LIYLNLEREADTATEIGNVVRATVEITAINEDTDIFGEAIFQAATDITESGAVAIPGSTATHEDVRSEVQGADRVTKEEVSRQWEVLGNPLVGIPLGFVSDTEVAGEEEVQTKSTAGARTEVAAFGPVESGIESVDLELHVTEEAVILYDDNLFFERFGARSGKHTGQGHSGSQHGGEDEFFHS